MGFIAIIKINDLISNAGLTLLQSWHNVVNSPIMGISIIYY